MCKEEINPGHVKMIAMAMQVATLGIGFAEALKRMYEDSGDSVPALFKEMLLEVGDNFTDDVCRLIQSASAIAKSGE